MPTRFEAYENLLRRAGEDDQTLLDIFVKLFRDVDARLVLAEDQAAGAAAIEKELTDYGLGRIDTAVQPVVAAIRAAASLGAILSASSVSAVTISAGVKTFTVVEADRPNFAPSAMLVAVANDDPSCVMWGRRISYSGATGELSIEVLSVSGAGTFSSWTVSTGAMVTMAAQAAAVPYGEFAGNSVQLLLTELMGALAGNPDFAADVAGAISDAANAARAAAVSDLRAGVPAGLDTLAEIAAALGLRVDVGAAQSFTVAQQRMAKTNMGAIGGQMLAKTADYSVVETDNGAVVMVDASAGARTITLPDAAALGAGFIVCVKKADTSANAVTVAGSLLEGGTSLALGAVGQSVIVASQTTGWRVLAEARAPRLLAASANKTANYTVTGADNGNMLRVDASGASRTVTLPAATTVPAGFALAIKKVDATVNTVTIAGTIDGAANYVLRRGQQSVIVVSDGTVWSIVSEAADQPPLTRFSAKTANYTLTLADDGGTVTMDASAAARQFTLPASAPIGYAVTLRKGDSSGNAVTVVGTIDGQTNYLLVAAQQAVTIVYDGANWLTVGSSRADQTYTKISPKAANYTVVAADIRSLLVVDAAAANRTITLPAANAVPAGFTVKVKKGDSSFNTVTVSGTIDGSANYLLRLPQQAAEFASDGSSWYLAGESGTAYVATTAGGRVVRFANGWQYVTAVVTFDYTGPVSDSSRLSYAWTFPAMFQAGDKMQNITLPAQNGGNYIGITGGRAMVKLFGGDGSVSQSACNFSIFFETGSVSTTTGAVTRCSISVEGLW